MLSKKHSRSTICNCLTTDVKLTFSIFEQHFKKPGLMALWVEEILWLTSVINPVQWAGGIGEQSNIFPVSCKM